MPKLRNVLFVSVQGDGEDRFLNAAELAINAIEDDGPTLVGTYKLVGKRRLIKSEVMQEAPKKSTR